MTLTGTNLPYFVEAGAGGRVVLFLHGIGGGHALFQPQLEAVAAAGLRGVAWDMPGYGFSRTVEPYSMTSLAEACRSLIELLEPDELTLVGHSMGGMVAQELVAQEPGIVGRLVLAGTSAAFGSADGTWQREFIAQRMAPLQRGLGMRDLARELLPTLVAATAPPEARDRAIESMASVPPTTYRHALGALVGFDRRAALAGISQPTLLVAGAHDAVAPVATMQKMADRIAGSRLVVIPGAGHLMNVEEPAAFNAALVEFVSERGPGAGDPARGSRT